LVTVIFSRDLRYPGYVCSCIHKQDVYSFVFAQWNLVCSRGWLVWLTQSVYMAGRVIGTQLYGFLLDRFDLSAELCPRGSVLRVVSIDQWNITFS